MGFCDVFTGKEAGVNAGALIFIVELDEAVCVEAVEEVVVGETTVFPLFSLSTGVARLDEVVIC